MKIRLTIPCLLGSIPLFLLFCGCSTSYLSQPSSELRVNTVGTLEPSLEVGEKIEATATVRRICYLFISGPSKFAEGVNYGDCYKGDPIMDSFWGDTIAEAKAAAAYKACVESKADFIICPRYYVIVDSYPFYRKVNVKVFGYKGVLKGVHLPKKKEGIVKLVQIVNPIKMADPIGIDIDKPIKLVQPIQVSPSPLQLIQPIEVIAKGISSDTVKN